MSKYSIEGSTLTALGDAVRNKTGKLTKPGYVDSQILNITIGAHGYYKYVFPAGVRSVKIKILSVNIEDAISYEMQPYYTASYYVKFNGATEVIAEVRDDKSNLYFWNTTSERFVGSYELTLYDVNGDIVQVQGEDVKNTLTPAQMAKEIEAIELGVKLPEEAYTITGDCQYKFANNGWNWFIDACGDKLTTKDIINISNMFYYSNKLTSIPFDINLDKSASSYDMSNVFNYCQNLIEVPYLKGELNPPTSNYGSNPAISYLFQNCSKLRYIPDDYFDQFGGDAFWAAAQTYTKNRHYNFTNCYSLRKMPTSWVKLKNKNNSYYSHLYYFAFNSCHSLDEVINIPIESTVALTSNCFYNTFDNCNRLKNILFETNEDGSPIVVNWKSQTITLTGDVGKGSSDSLITGYNSGITVDKKVSDDASYQALKDDPDWYTLSWDYSRYNRTSAVATINSLPDTSAGGANIIKFKGAAGALTDGGAINTMTEEEIAVATAKGWTVSLS